MKHPVTLIFADGRRLAASVDSSDWPLVIFHQDPASGEQKFFAFNGATTFKEVDPPEVKLTVVREGSDGAL